ncbi:MAG: PorV/PorQ family protein [Flavobacteriales bacterium]|nr:PorV/PorQ family protein [Flavobacteriales bacterium]
MRRILRISFIALCSGMFAFPAIAGNSDRAGQAGATELLINPWARSSGFASANAASVRGLEAQYLNVAGMAFTTKTEVLFTNTQWLVGSGVMINSFGLSQKVGEAGVIGLSVMNMSFGEIDITTSELPDGGNGTFTPNYLNIGISYAKSFSNSINGGITVRIINQSISNLSASGVAFDAGISYTTRLGNRDKEKNKDNVQFGISLKNVGPPMKYKGDGLSVRGTVPGGDNSLTLEYRSAKYEMPSSLNIGVTYHWRDNKLVNRVTAAGTFTSNSFSKDQFNFGLEYSFKEMFMLRGGYQAIFGKGGKDIATSALVGPTVGATVEVGLGKKGADKKTKLGIDYSYRLTNPFSGVHAIGVRLAL